MDIEERDEEVFDLVRAARDYVHRTMEVDLDLSPASLAVVDHYMKAARTAEPEVRRLVVMTLGAYFGEVVRRRFGGRWRKVGQSAATWLVELDVGGVCLCPVGMAAEAVEEGQTEGYDGTLQVPNEHLEVLSEVLDRRGPVDPASYYSLSGRLDVIEMVVEALSALSKQRG
jgi:hypothetical protein